MTTYSCRLVDVDDQAIAGKIVSAANDLAAIAIARHLFAGASGDAIEAWEGDRLVYRERLCRASFTAPARSVARAFAVVK